MRSKVLALIGIMVVGSMLAGIKGISYGDLDLDLTQEETEFIEDHPVIRMGIDPTFMPFEFIDLDGTYKGLASAYVDLISEKTGLEMVFEADLTWSEAYIRAVEKDIDLLPCISMTDERAQHFLFSEPYYEFQRVIFLREDSKVKNYKDLFNKRVAIQKNSSHEGHIDLYPQIEINYYETVEAGLKALAEGREEAFVGNLATSNYLITKNGLTDLKYVTFEAQSKNFLYFAIREDWPELQSIINKALAAITESEKIEIHNQWVGIIKATDYTKLIKGAILVFSVIFLLAVVSIYWILKLRREIKKRIEIEAHLKVAKREADLSNEVKSNFLARMSHEIRTPLNAITGLSYILDKSDLDRSQKAHLDKISHASSVMLSIINDILDFSKIEAGKVEIDNEAFDLDLVIKNVLNIISFRIEEKSLDFTLIKEPNLPNHFFGDAKRIEQILLNLINNAVKFTDQGGISFGVHLIGFQRDHYQIEFRIKDTGIGMSPDHMKHLFEPFNQEDSSISRRFGGTGLGLSIVKNLTELMAGDITVNSQVGQGSEFIVSLNLLVNQEKEQAVKNNFKYIKDIKTLILNKKMNTLSLTAQYLNSFGIMPEYTSSMEAFEQLLTGTQDNYVAPYNLLIIDMDHVSPEAFERFEEVYETMDQGNLHVILLSKYMNDQASYNEKFVILSKPIFPSILYNTIVNFFHYTVMASQMDHPGSKDEGQVDGRVLIVEDNKTNQLIAKTLLETMGLEVVVADNGALGLEAFKAQAFDLILMDLHMPVMDGYESCRQIRLLNKTLPIIAMTADAVDGVKGRCDALGMTHFISKPFDPDQFMAEVKTYLEENPQNQVPVFKPQLGIKQLGGDEKIFKEVLHVFVEENQGTLKALLRAIDDKDYFTAIQVVHKVKSSAGSIGSDLTRISANSLQKALETEDSEAIQREAEVFMSTLKALLEAIDQYKS